ncbi:heptosyltransferase [Nautilia sp. PV-1]|uniref:glycosyltransferase family 9 protein n=1 Tax=Nautilia sp. PV-1 TaxID=2579250 RepID=UPI000FDA4CB8|nr:glycosyltransferase family 9 protein [Nautilia sp. PV-1]AZV47380.1 heptosyltransferase [Nautilia sp. PV-1]
MKILLIRNDNLGDLICTTPAIEGLRKKYPNAQIDIVVNSYNFLGIRNNPFVDNIYVYTKPKHVNGVGEKLKALFGKIKIFNGIRKEKYDVSVVFRSEYSPSTEQFSNISKAKMRIGVKDKKKRDKFTHHIEFRNNHEVEFCFDCLKPLNVEYNGEKTRFFIPKEMKKKYEDFKDIVVFHISARMKNNQMSFEKLKDIFAKLDKEIYITAEPKDFETAKKLEKETKVIFKKTDSFLDLGAFISRAKLFVTLEGGAMHLAPAIEVKTIALFGISDINRWHPWGYKDLVLQDKSKIAENIDNDLIVKHIKNNL